MISDELYFLLPDIPTEVVGNIADFIEITDYKLYFSKTILPTISTLKPTLYKTSNYDVLYNSQDCGFATRIDKYADYYDWFCKKRQSLY